jgi:hypothetical protein
MKKYLIIVLLFTTTNALALVGDVFDITMSIIDRANKMERQEDVKIKGINRIILSKKSCEASILLTKRKLNVASQTTLSRLTTINERAKFMGIYLQAQNNLYKKLIFCNKTAIIGIQKQIRP